MIRFLSIFCNPYPPPNQPILRLFSLQLDGGPAGPEDVRGDWLGAGGTGGRQYKVGQIPHNN